MGTTPTPDPRLGPASASQPSTHPYHENGVHRWSEAAGDERRGYRMSCEDCGLPAWGGTPAMAMTRAQQMDCRHVEWARQPLGTPHTLVEELLRHLDPPDVELVPDDEIDLAPLPDRELRCVRCGDPWRDDATPCCMDPVSSLVRVVRRDGLTTVYSDNGEVIAAVREPTRPACEIDLTPPTGRAQDAGMGRGL